MWISLSKKAAMWFLGDTKNVKVSLNFQDRGPTEIDFETLLQSEQKHILLSLQKGVVTTDTPFNELLDIYRKRQQKEAPPPVVQEYLDKQKVDQRQQKLLKIKAAAEKRAEDIKKRSAWLAKQTMRAIKADLKEEKDVKMLRSFYEVEKANKNRAGVLRLVEEKIRTHQKEVAIKIEDSKDDRPIVIKSPEATFPGDVIESEEVEVTLTPEQLKKLAAGGSLGGE